MKGRVLIVAGSDSGGGAGIQADIKTVTALGGFAATAITALTAQNTKGVFGVVAVAPDFVAQQMRVVLEDIGADALKTGMLANASIITVVAQTITALARNTPLVLDPVMVATSGDKLLDDNALDALKQDLAPLAVVMTPNIPEAEALTDMEIRDLADMQRAAAILLSLGPRAVLLKGGHLVGETVIDVLADHAGLESFSAPRIATKATHGTGCTLASGIATGLAQGLALRDAVIRARAYVRRALETAPGYGAGHGPMNHAHPLEK